MSALYDFFVGGRWGVERSGRAPLRSASELSGARKTVRQESRDACVRAHIADFFESLPHKVILESVDAFLPRGRPPCIASCGRMSESAPLPAHVAGDFRHGITVLFRHR